MINSPWNIPVQLTDNVHVNYHIQNISQTLVPDGKHSNTGAVYYGGRMHVTSRRQHYAVNENLSN